MKDVKEPVKVKWLSYEEWRTFKDWFDQAESQFRYMNKDIKFW